MRVKESEKAGLKLNTHKTKIMASDSITSWQIGGKKVGTVTDFIFLGSKITGDGDAAFKLKDACSLEEKLWQTSPASSFFLELFLHSSPVAYWIPTDLDRGGGAHIPVSYLSAFSYCSWGSWGNNTWVVCHLLLQWTEFCQMKIQLNIAFQNRILNKIQQFSK